MTLVQLDRRTDLEKPCCRNIATIGAGKGPHAAELRCSVCGNHRGWLPRQALDFIRSLAETFGNSAEPIILRDDTFGGQPLKKFDDTNCGVLFREDNKSEPADRDYSGSINIAGVDYWLSGWVKTSKKGSKFLSLSVRPKAAVEAKPEFDDAIPL